MGKLVVDTLRMDNVYRLGALEILIKSGEIDLERKISEHTDRLIKRREEMAKQAEFVSEQTKDTTEKGKKSQAIVDEHTAKMASLASEIVLLEIHLHNLKNTLETLQTYNTR